MTLEIRGDIYLLLRIEAILNTENRLMLNFYNNIYV